jgi:hypothetical protein
MSVPFNGRESEQRSAIAGLATPGVEKKLSVQNGVAGCVREIACGHPKRISLHAIQQCHRQEIVSSGHAFWRADPNGDLSAIVSDLRLIIQPCDGFTRYLIVQRGAAEIMLGSGNEIDLSKAPVVALRTVKRMQFMLTQRGQT